MIKEVSKFWKKYNIPVKQEYNSVAKLQKLHDKMQSIRKSSGRTSTIQKEEENIFIDELDHLFDIAHHNALSMMTIEKDKNFLIMQRKHGRPGSALAQVKRHKKDEEPSVEAIESESVTSVFTIDEGGKNAIIIKPSESHHYLFYPQVHPLVRKLMSRRKRNLCLLS